MTLEFQDARARSRYPWSPGRTYCGPPWVFNAGALSISAFCLRVMRPSGPSTKKYPSSFFEAVSEKSALNRTGEVYAGMKRVDFAPKGAKGAEAKSSRFSRASTCILRRWIDCSWPLTRWRIFTRRETKVSEIQERAIFWRVWIMGAVLQNKGVRYSPTTITED